MLLIITIALDAMPFLPTQLSTFNRLSCGWRWYVIEGRAKNLHDTSWCAEMEPRLSTDGSHEWLLDVAGKHPNVTHIHKPYWNGKIEMFHAAVEQIHKLRPDSHGPSSVVLECDSDELWTKPQLERIHDFFLNCPAYNAMQFKADYFLGPNLHVVSDQCYGNRGTEWLRAWRFHDRFAFIRHEAPEVVSSKGKLFTRDQTERMGLVFEHYSYVYRSQLVEKQSFYGYKNCVQEWEALQRNTEWPIDASKFCSWIPAGCIVDRVNK